MTTTATHGVPFVLPLPVTRANMAVTRRTLLRQSAVGSALTRRELEILQLIARGMRNKEIAANLCISEQTVQVHVKNIRSKLEVHDRTAAVVVAAQRGLISIAQQ